MEEESRCPGTLRVTDSLAMDFFILAGINFELPSVILARHTSLFLDKLRHCDKYLIKKCYAYLTNLFCSDFVYL